MASDVEGLKDIVANAGILFTPKNEVELASCILKLMNDKDYYNMIADKCKQRSLCFNSDIMAESYVQLYNEILKEE